MKIFGLKLTVIAAIIILSAAGPNGVRAEKSAEQIMADLESKASTVTSYSADMAMTMSMMGQKMTTNGKYVFKTPNKIWMETEMDMGAMKMKQIYISNGKTAWAYQPTMKMVTKINMEKITAEMKDSGMGQKPGDISKPFQGFDKESVSFDRTDTIGGEKVYVFKGTPQNMNMDKMPFAISIMEMWIGADNGLAMKMAMFNEEGVEIMTQTYSNIELNIEVDESRFEFTPPEGVQVMDMTEGSMNMMKEMQKKPE